ncbi:unnamed protein product [Protopolystoma xenopodis]|uniref:Amino acid transporter transmembrane domain-containing protein n=1 Tax=Protopolystoma xenopodis TaxID=117903 RepID=A0A3S4ZN77_9PLAT|nr:unnamed protein product [Protopolystoma xenopodis]
MLLRTRSTYSCIAAAVWPRGGRPLVSLVVITELFGALVLYLILLGQSAASLLSHLPGLAEWPPVVWTLIVCYVQLPLLMWPRMKVVAWFTVVAVFGLLISLVCVVVCCMMALPGGEVRWSNLPQPEPTKLPVSLGRGCRALLTSTTCQHYFWYA